MHLCGRNQLIKHKSKSLDVCEFVCMWGWYGEAEIALYGSVTHWSKDRREKIKHAQRLSMQHPQPLSNNMRLSARVVWWEATH